MDDKKFIALLFVFGIMLGVFYGISTAFPGEDLHGEAVVVFVESEEIPDHIEGFQNCTWGEDCPCFEENCST